MYVDGFVVPVPRARIAQYREMAEKMLDVWIEHGALSGVEAMGEDVPEGEITSFPMAVKLEPGEVVFFSRITCRDRTHRDSVNAKVVADPRAQPSPEGSPFDARRMIWGGFVPVVTKGAD